MQYEDAATAEQHAAAEAAALAAATGVGPYGQPLPEDPAERRKALKMLDAARRQAEEEIEYEEVPQPDDNGGEMPQPDEDADGL